MEHTTKVPPKIGRRQLKSIGLSGGGKGGWDWDWGWGSEKKGAKEEEGPGAASGSRHSSSLSLLVVKPVKSSWPVTMMLMLDRGKLAGWSRDRMAGRIDGKEWMAMWICMGTSRKGGSCKYAPRRPCSLGCVRGCVCVSVFCTNTDPSAGVNQTIKSVKPSNISNTAKAGWA